MAVINEGIRIEGDNTLSFGNFSVKDKLKVSGFEFGGDIYKIKTHDGITRLEKNEKLLIESVPGAAFFNFSETQSLVTFSADGYEDTQVTMELEPEAEYRASVDGAAIGEMKSNLSGKISFSLELGQSMKNIKIEKIR